MFIFTPRRKSYGSAKIEAVKDATQCKKTTTEERKTTTSDGRETILNNV